MVIKILILGKGSFNITFDLLKSLIPSMESPFECILKLILHMYMGGCRKSCPSLFCSSNYLYQTSFLYKPTLPIFNGTDLLRILTDLNIYRYRGLKQIFRRVAYGGTSLTNGGYKKINF